MIPGIEDLLPPPPKKKQSVSEDGLLPPPPKKKMDDGTGIGAEIGGEVGGATSKAPLSSTGNKKDNFKTGNALLDRQLTAQPELPVSKKPVEDIFNPATEIIKKREAQTFTLPSRILSEVEITDEDIPGEIMDKRGYRVMMQQRLSNKTPDNLDLEIIAKKTGQPIEAVEAYATGRDGKGVMIEFDKVKEKNASELSSILINANKDLGLNDSFENIFSTPQTAKLYIDKIEKLYEQKAKQDAENFKTGNDKAVFLPENMMEAEADNINRGMEIIGKESNARVARIKNIIGKEIFTQIANNPDLTYDQKVKESGNLVFSNELDNINSANTKRFVKDNFGAMNPLNQFGKLFRNEDKETKNLNSINAVVETQLQNEIQKQLIYEQAALEELSMQVLDKANSGTLTDEEKSQYKQQMQQMQAGIESKKQQYKSPQKLQEQYPIILKQSVINDINELNAIQSGNVKGYEDGGYNGISLREHLKAKGYDMNNQVVKDAISDAESGVGVKDYSFFGEPIKAIKDVFVNSAKSVGDIVGVRDDVTALSEKKEAELFPVTVSENDRYQLTETVKTSQNIFNTTGQVIGQGLLQIGTAGLGRMAGLTRLASSNLGFWSSGALTSYDQAYKDSFDFIETGAGRTTYAGLIALSNAAAEKIFPEAKIFTIPGVKSAFTELAYKVGTGELTDKLADQLLNKAKDAFIDYGKKYVKNVGSEVIEETATSLFESGARYVYGDENMNFAEALKNAKNTAVQTAIGTTLIGGMGAYRDVQSQKNISPSSTIYNAAIYKDDAMDALQIGFEQGLYDQQELNRKISLLNTAEVGVSELKKAEQVVGRELSRPQKELFVANTTAIKLLLENKKNTTDEATIEKIDKKLENLKNQQSQLLDDKVQFDEFGNVVADTKLTVPVEGLDEQGIPIGDNVPPPEKIFTDFDKTLFHNGKLTDLGEEIKQKVANGENITVLTARENTPENIDFIARTLGIPHENIKAGLDPDGKAAELTSYEGSKVFYDDNPDNVAAAQKTNARVIDTGITSDEQRIPTLFRDLQETGNANEYLNPEKITESIEEIQNQALTAPSGLKGKVGEKLTVELIARNSVEDINKQIEKLETSIKGEGVTATQTKDADRHITLLLKGLEAKAKGNIPVTPEVKGTPEKANIIETVKLDGKEINAIYLDEHKGQKIVEIDGDVYTYDPKNEVLFKVALDDSKTGGNKKKVNPDANNVETAKGYIDWVESGKKGEQPVIDITPSKEVVPVVSEVVGDKTALKDVAEEKVFTTNALKRADAKKVFAEIRKMDAPQDAAQIALEYVASGGKVSENAINEVVGTVKRASLNTGARELKTNEVKSRDYADKNASTLDQIAHDLWELSDQRVSETDIRDALMDVIGSYNTRLEAGKSYLERYSPEYIEKVQQEKFYKEHLEEIAAEEKAINDYLNSEKEIENEAFSDINYVTKLIEKYEAESKSENQQSPTKTESGINKGTGSETSSEKTKQNVKEQPQEVKPEIKNETPVEVTKGIIKRIENNLNAAFEGDKVKVLSNEEQLLKKAEELGEGVKYQTSLKDYVKIVLTSIALSGTPIQTATEKTPVATEINEAELKNKQAITKLLESYYAENDETVPPEVIERALKVWDRVGRPEILPDSTKNNDRAYALNQPKVVLGNITNFDDLVAELSHAAQFISKAELDERGYATQQEYDSVEYERTGSAEYDAHKLIEPMIAAYILNGKKIDETVNSKESQQAISKYGLKDILFMTAPDGTVLGFEHKGEIYLNGQYLNTETVLHESGHVWASWAKQSTPEIYKRGIELTENSKYLKDVKENDFYKKEAELLPENKREEYFQQEALAAAIGDKGAQLVGEARKNDFKEWLNDLWNSIKEAVGFKNITAEELQNLTFDEFAKRAAADILIEKPKTGEAALIAEVRKKIEDAAATKKSVKSKQDAMEAEAAKYGELGASILKDINDGKEPPIPPKSESGESHSNKLKDKGILNRLYDAENVPESAKEGFKEKGLKYKPESREEKAKLAKAIVEELGINEAVLNAKALTFDDGVNSAVFAESLTQLKQMEDKATSKEEKFNKAKEFAKLSIEYDEWARGLGREISQIQEFYESSPLGIVIKQNTENKDDFDKWAKPKEKSWNEFLGELNNLPEFKDFVDKKVNDELKKERAENRKDRIKKVDDTIDGWINDLNSGKTLFALPVPPPILVAALKGVKVAYRAGEATAKIIQDAVNYVTEKMGDTDWNEKGFREKVESLIGSYSKKNALDTYKDRLRNQIADLDKQIASKARNRRVNNKTELDDEAKELVKQRDEKKKQLEDVAPLSETQEYQLAQLEKFRKKLKGLSESEKDEVIRNSFTELINNGALSQEDFRRIIAHATGRGDLTTEQSAKMKELVRQTNSVEDFAKRFLERKTEQSYENYKKSQIRAAKAARDLSDMFDKKADYLKVIAASLQGNTLGLANVIVLNPAFNLVNQWFFRLPNGAMQSLAGVIMGKPGWNTVFSRSVQRQFFRELAQGVKESNVQLVTGMSRSDYDAKEIYTDQIRPLKSGRELWHQMRSSKQINALVRMAGGKEVERKEKLTKNQIIHRAFQVAPGTTAELIFRLLNYGDKPMRFAAGGSKAAAVAKSLGIKPSTMDWKVFMEFPREEAYRLYKKQGLSDKEATDKADTEKESILQEGKRSTMQQDNLFSDLITTLFNKAESKTGLRKDSGAGQLAKATLVSPYLKIPSNVFWAYFTAAHPVIALAEATGHLISSQRHKRNGDIVKSNLQQREARYWLGHAAVGIAINAVIIPLVKSGVITPSADGEDDPKKEREGEQTYGTSGTFDVVKFYALITGEDPKKVKNGFTIPLKMFGTVGMIGNSIGRDWEDMNNEERENRSLLTQNLLEFWDTDDLKELQNGIFSNTTGLLGTMAGGGGAADRYFINLINMYGNLVQPAAIAQISRAQMPYYTKQKADTFLGQLDNSLLSRSSLYRDLSGRYPPTKYNIWGQPMKKDDNFVFRMLGFNRVTKDNFAQPIFEDAQEENDVNFFPPAVTDKLAGKKLNTEQYDKLQQYVGQARKLVIEPYINDKKKIPEYGFYSKIKDKEVRKDRLNYMYGLGRKLGLDKFYLEYPEFKPTEKTETEKEESKTKKDSNEALKEADTKEKKKFLKEKIIN